jgi:CRP-like cAMP-binding protein
MSALAAQSFLRNLPGDCIARLAEMARHVSVPAGHRLFDEDSPARKFWIIDAGQVALETRLQATGARLIEARSTTAAVAG